MEKWQDARLGSWGKLRDLGTETGSRMGFAAKSYKRKHEPPAEIRHVENFLLQLCRAKNWSGVLHRCRSHPEEAVPQPMNENRFDLHSSKRVVNENLHGKYGQDPLYQETALGFACSSTNIQTDELKAVILALVVACPDQVRSSQLISGHTPLRDAIINPLCTPEVLKIMMKGDLTCDKRESKNTKSAFHKKDRSGLYPVDHLIIGVQLGSSSHCISLLKEFTRSQPKTTKPSFSDSMSPLIRLLTMGTSFGVQRSEIEFSPWSSSRNEDRTRLNRILEVAKFLLKEDPTLIYKPSHVTGCSPLHVALRNYGDYFPLIDLLTSKDEPGKLIKLRNHYGDLPLHVASSVGVPHDVLKLIIDRTLAVERAEDQSKTSFFNPLVWSVNKSGYTPIDLEWVRHIESGKGFYTARSFYPLEQKGVRRRCFKQDEYYQDLLREAVDQVIEHHRDEKYGNPTNDREETAKHTFGVLIDRLSLLISSACVTSIPSKSRPSLLHDICKLSTPCGPSLPLPLLELFLWVYPDKLIEQDEAGNLPIHYALGRSQPLSAPSDSKCCNDWNVFVEKLLQAAPESCKIANKNGRLPLHMLLDYSNLGFGESNREMEHSRHDIIEKLIRINPESIDRRDPETNLDPFMLAAKDPHLLLDSVFSLLLRSPSRCFNREISTSNLLSSSRS